MKIIEVRSLVIPEIKIIRFARFMDVRGYFTETHRESDFSKEDRIGSLRGLRFLQHNESYSRAGTIRGMHFQWNPFMGKLVRTISGRMIDLILDIRVDESTFGSMIAYDMPSDQADKTGEWIWIPPGFAHGNVFTKDTVIEYLCTGEYNQECEAGISPLAKDINWSLCDAGLKRTFDEIAEATTLITEKDRNGVSVNTWANDSRADNFSRTSLPRV
jgi:dTDP-4-dehydrorhamnose 3,5-epimerase